MDNVTAKKMGFECIALIGVMLSRQLTQDQIYIAIMDLHNKYPMLGHDPPLNKYQYQHFRTMHLQPQNFKEAAEMYVRRESIKGKRVEVDFKTLATGETEDVLP